MRVLAGHRDRAAHVLLAVVAQVAPRERHAPRLGIEEAQEQVDDGGLPGAARAHERDAAARLEAQADPVERRALAGRVARAHVLQRHRERPRRRGQRRGGIDDGGLAIGELEHPAAGRERDRQLARGGGQRLDRLEGGQREQGEHRDEHAVQVPVGGRAHGHGEHARHGRADDGEPGAVGEPAHEGVAAREPDEGGVGGAQACLRARSAPP